MITSRVATKFTVATAFLSTLIAAVTPAQAQQAQLTARIIVTGEGTVPVAPDYAQIMTGVTTRETTAQAATAANSKIMTSINAALLGAGIAQSDIRTARFSLSPVYGSPQPNSPPPRVGYSVANQIIVKVRQIDKAGQILDALITAGATDAGSIQFLHSDPGKALDEARQAALADARHKAELYAQAAGLRLGGVAWISEEPAASPPLQAAAVRSYAAAAAPVPISPGEDTLRVQITVGFEVAQ